MLARCMISAVVVWTGCAFQGNAPEDPTVTIHGQVVDFQTGAAVDAVTDLTVAGLIPSPLVEHQGASFTLSAVPENSAFEVLATAALHRPTYSPVVVTTSGFDHLSAPVVSEAFIAALATAFGAAPSPAKGIVLLHLVDAMGKGQPGVAGKDFAIAGSTGPRFLDGNMVAAATATASSASGWAVFFDVPPGLVGLTQGASSTTTIDMPTLPSAAGVVTIAEGKVTPGAPVLPSNVSFAQQIVPIFAARGCVVCHSGGGPGKDLGGLNLGGGANSIYKELVMERKDIRVNLALPEKSLVLTMPSAEDPPDGHPTIVFAGPRDPDYLKLLVWIREGAKQN